MPHANSTSQRRTGDVVLVTGAARGLGAALVDAFLEVGCRVAACDLDGDEMRARYEDYSGSISLHTVDLTEVGAVSHWMTAVMAEYGRIDTLVNNAGMFHEENSFDITDETWQRVLDVNLTSAFRCSIEAARHMRENGADGGAIVNIASGAGLQARYDRTPYCVTKAGVIHLTRCLALDLARFQIRVNCVAPGFMQTRMMSAILGIEEEERKALARVPLGRFGETSEIAAAVVFLASNSARYITGEFLGVNGGSALL